MFIWLEILFMCFCYFTNKKPPSTHIKWGSKHSHWIEKCENGRENGENSLHFSVDNLIVCCNVLLWCFSSSNFLFSSSYQFSFYWKWWFWWVINENLLEIILFSSSLIDFIVWILINHKNHWISLENVWLKKKNEKFLVLRKGKTKKKTMKKREVDEI